MDLAQHLKMASEEVKTLRNVAGLIKHDVLALSDPTTKGQLDCFAAASTSVNNDFNPFLTGRNDGNTELKEAHLV